MINLPVAFLLLALTSLPLSASMLIDVDGNEHALPDLNSKGERRNSIAEYDTRD